MLRFFPFDYFSASFSIFCIVTRASIILIEPLFLVQIPSVFPQQNQSLKCRAELEITAEDVEGFEVIVVGVDAATEAAAAHFVEVVVAVVVVDRWRSKCAREFSAHQLNVYNH